ncbi:hypothetical protein FJT64_008318 [Amphibalanus amphitrite]|uniref:RNase H type-1 domain-containing protein n=1 Tax=Amphibalanus amphitrite TaxID=1232801 RepID=A0A6A4VR81_AMPAM|nr:hypothetical protein FJT64_008318 [Amphibalanus amphitrite]
MLAAARTITGCPISTPRHAVRAEAGVVPMAARRDALAARLLAKAHSLPPEDPLHAVAEAAPVPRLKSVTGWRDRGRAVWDRAGVELPVEARLATRPPPWTATENVTIRLDIGPLPIGATASMRRSAAEACLGALPQCATWAWTDGSATGGVTNGGAGVLIEHPDGTTEALREAAGKICSSYRAEMVALKTAVRHLLEHPPLEQDIIICSDSQASLATLRGGPAAQTSPLGAAIWEHMAALVAGGDRRVHLQWVPSHCELEGNERVDAIAKEAATLPQQGVPVDVRTVYRAASRMARKEAISNWPDGWYRRLMDGHLPAPLPSTTPREVAVDVHQLRAGHWSGSAQYLHRIGRNPGRDCAQCNSLTCRAAGCRCCGEEEADTPAHILLRCPALMRLRLRHLGNIHPSEEEVRGSGVVAALGAAARYLQSREAT